MRVGHILTLVVLYLCSSPRWAFRISLKSIRSIKQSALFVLPLTVLSRGVGDNRHRLVTSMLTEVGSSYSVASDVGSESAPPKKVGDIVPNNKAIINLAFLCTEEYPWLSTHSREQSENIRCE